MCIALDWETEKGVAFVWLCFSSRLCTNHPLPFCVSVRIYSCIKICVSLYSSAYLFSGYRWSFILRFCERLMLFSSSISRSRAPIFFFFFQVCIWFLLAFMLVVIYLKLYLCSWFLCILLCTEKMKKKHDLCLILIFIWFGCMLLWTENKCDLCLILILLTTV